VSVRPARAGRLAVEIGSLVVDGFDPGDQRGISAAVSREVARALGPGLHPTEAAAVSRAVGDHVAATVVPGARRGA
jgi:hypothetical protein